jgi:hypothetical protein
LVEVDLNSDTLLVRADVAQAQIAKTAQMGSTTAAGSTGGGPTPGVEQTPSPILGRSGPPDEPASPPRPRRFYAKVTLDRTAPRRKSAISRNRSWPNFIACEGQGLS